MAKSFCKRLFLPTNTEKEWRDRQYPETGCLFQPLQFLSGFRQTGLTIGLRISFCFYELQWQEQQFHCRMTVLLGHVL